MAKKILVAVDGSDHSRKAAMLAAKYATALDAEELHLLHAAVDVRSIVTPKHTWQWWDMHETFQRMGRRVLETIAAEMAENWSGEIQTHLLVGSVAAVISEHAREGEFDLLVIGSRGLSGLASWTLGSVSNKLVQIAPCSVLVVR